VTLFSENTRDTRKKNPVKGLNVGKGFRHSKKAELLHVFQNRIFLQQPHIKMERLLN